MKITTKNVMEINATKDERIHLEITNDMLGEVLNYFENIIGNLREGIIFTIPPLVKLSMRKKSCGREVFSSSFLIILFWKFGLNFLSENQNPKAD